MILLPLRYNVQYNEARIQRIHGSLVHPEYLFFNAANYLDPRHIEIKNVFPYPGLTVRTEHSSFTLDQRWSPMRRSPWPCPR